MNIPLHALYISNKYSKVLKSITKINHIGFIMDGNRR